MNRIEVEIDDPTYGRLVFDGLEGGGSGGEPVLLLHGFPQTSWLWRHQLPALAEAGYRAVAIDQRGYSPRARPEPVEAYRSDFLTADVLGVADQLGFDRFHVVGHDWGGIVAWQLGGRHGDRLLTLNVLSTPHPQAFVQAIAGGGDPEVAASTGQGNASDQSQRSSYMDIFRREGSELGLLANEMTGLRMVLEATGLSHEQAGPYIEALGTPDALRAALNWYRAADLTLVMGLSPIKVPTMYIWSTDDLALGPDAAKTTGDFVQGPYRFEVLDGVSHWIVDQKPDDVTRLLLDHLAHGEEPRST